MLAIGDPRWAELKGGYRVPYDPRPALARLRQGDGSVWDELWQELHHQGDVGEASYAVVPHLIDIAAKRETPEWQIYSMIGTIEMCRDVGQNPPLPAWLATGYWDAWREVVTIGCRDLQRTEDALAAQMILGAMAYAKGLRPTAEVLLDFTADELGEMVGQYRS